MKLATKSLIAILFLFIPHLVLGQTDSAVEKSRINWLTFNDVPHSPKKASVYSAIIPGLGQVYNHKVWKVPIIYGALGGSLFFAIDNRRKMRTLNDDFYVRFRDQNTANDPSTTEIEERNTFRRNRDVGILIFTTFYALQVFDAAVDAHFYKINLDQDLNVKIKPNMSQLLCLSYKF